MSRASRQRARERRRQVRAAQGKRITLRKVRREIVEATQAGVLTSPDPRVPLTVKQVQEMRARRRG